MTPTKLGRYEILGELGKGAMGVVYLARDPLIGRQLALKTFRLGYSAADQELEQFRARFLREAQSAGILSHPNIVTIHDVVEGEDGAFFIAMEYVKGTDLKQLMQRQEQLATPFVIDIVAQIAEALDYAHSKGVVHRDIKPANIILTADKQVKITDFGIARVDASNLTVEGQLLGTPNYMAPEQVQGLEVDHRADLFSLGVMFYEMLTRHKPFYGENLTVVTHRIVNDSFTPPERYVAGLPPSVMTVLEQALQKNPDERYASGREMAKQLRGLIEPRQTATAKTDAPPAFESFLPDIEVPPPPSDLHPAPSLPAAATAAPLAAAPPTPSPSTPSPPTPSPSSSSGVPASRKPSWQRLAILILGTVLVVGSAGVLAHFAFKGEEVVDRPSPETELQRRYLPFVKTGQQQLEQGDPSAALEAFQKALAIVPDDQHIRRLRDQAKQEVLASDGLDSEQAYAERRLQLAQEALSSSQYQRAIRLAGEVLEVDPKNREADRIASEARQIVERKRRIQERFDTGRTASSGNEGARPPAASTELQVAAQAQLDIEFFSEISEGILTIYAGQDVLYKGNFRFVKKSGLLKRSRGTSGWLSSTHNPVPAGEVNFKIYVYKKGTSTLSRQLTAKLDPDSVHTLTVSLQENGVLEAEMKPGPIAPR